MSTPAHNTLSGQQFLTKNGMTPVAYPPYSPGLSPSNCLFPWMKKVLTGKRFICVEEVKQQTAALAGVAPWIERGPANQRVTGVIPSQGTCLGCRPCLQ